ncbi:REV1 [Symbiodinium natans]|uniref:REV1 protein n=1 Tax=Symbiodinium natans TaxID=878477 RepID=A0A812M5D6_9DINO|nr:REV1 [Symbiodinium natans]
MESAQQVKAENVAEMLGEDEGLYAKQGENNEPLRPDGGAFVPKCVGDAILKVDWIELRYGALVEVRLRYGPELQDVAPHYAKQFEQAKKDAHKKGRKGGAMCSILVQVFPPSYRPDADAEEGGTIVDESIPKDMEIE